MVFQITKDAAIYVWYQVNQESITEQYCVNIAKPEKMCYGKCHVMKVMDVDKQDTEDHKLLSTWKMDINLFFNEFNPYSLEHQIDHLAYNIPSSFFNYYQFDYQCVIDKPPTS